MRDCLLYGFSLFAKKTHAKTDVEKTKFWILQLSTKAPRKLHWKILIWRLIFPKNWNNNDDNNIAQWWQSNICCTFHHIPCSLASSAECNQLILVIIMVHQHTYCAKKKQSGHRKCVVCLASTNCTHTATKFIWLGRVLLRIMAVPTNHISQHYVLLALRVIIHFVHHWCAMGRTWVCSIQCAACLCCSFISHMLLLP